MNNAIHPERIGAILDSSVHDTIQADLRMGDDYEFESVCVITKDALAKKRENLGPSWPNGAVAADKILYIAPEDRPEPELAGPMAWPLLDAEGLAMYLERYTPEALTEAAKLSTHARHGLMERIPAPQGEDHVRVLRVIEYTGPRSLVEEQVRTSLHGTRDGIRATRLQMTTGRSAEDIRTALGPVQITAVTLGEYPEVLERARLQDRVPSPPLACLRPNPDSPRQLCALTAPHKGIPHSWMPAEEDPKVPAAVDLTPTVADGNAEIPL